MQGFVLFYCIFTILSQSFNYNESLLCLDIPILYNCFTLPFKKAMKIVGNLKGGNLVILWEIGNILTNFVKMKIYSSFALKKKHTVNFGVFSLSSFFLVQASFSQELQFCSYATDVFASAD